MTAKYVIIQDEEGFEYPFLFPPMINHDHFAAKFSGMGKPIAAGFVAIGDDNLSCYGESISLNIRSRGDGVDDKVLKRYFRH